MNTKIHRMSFLDYWGVNILLAVLIFAGFYFIGIFLKDGLYALASALGAIILFVSLVYFRRKFTPYRWLAIAIVFVFAFTIYPLFYTVFISFTNMSGGHLITKQQAIHRITSKKYLPEGAHEFSWTAYRSEKNDYLLLLESSDGSLYTAEEDEPVREVSGELDRFGPLESDGYPASIDGFERMRKKDIIPILNVLGNIDFGSGERAVTIQSISKAAAMQPLYTYDSERDRIINEKTGEEYLPERGTFTSPSGEKLIPGFKVLIGFDNYSRFLFNRGYARPISRIILWNITFALFSVLLSYIVGVTIAVLFDDLPGNRIIRSLLIIPYPIPVLVSITVWRGLLNEQLGLITGVLNSLFGTAPNFFTEKAWTRIALILINVYLSYPYFYIIASGAIRSISEEVFQAAKIDGAGGFATFRYITQPLILRILAPLIIASFSFNFNNFTIVWVFNTGLPAMADTIVPMGYTDLLISFVYRLGFTISNAADYGFAAAITVMLFLFVAVMVFFQTRSTSVFKEVRSEV